MSKPHVFQVRVTTDEDKAGVEYAAKRERRTIPSYFLWLHDDHLRGLEGGEPSGAEMDDALDQFQKDSVEVISTDENGKSMKRRVHIDMLVKQLVPSGKIEDYETMLNAMKVAAKRMEELEKEDNNRN